jgi:hypothetical protein
MLLVLGEFSSLSAAAFRDYRDENYPFFVVWLLAAGSFGRYPSS